MSDSPRGNDHSEEGARMKLEPKAIHETDDGVHVDCPKCGSIVSIVQIVTQGRCTGYLDEETTETGSDTELQEECTAELSLELVWYS